MTFSPKANNKTNMKYCVEQEVQGLRRKGKRRKQKYFKEQMIYYEWSLGALTTLI